MGRCYCFKNKSRCHVPQELISFIQRHYTISASSRDTTLSLVHPIVSVTERQADNVRRKDGALEISASENIQLVSAEKKSLRKSLFLSKQKSVKKVRSGIRPAGYQNNAMLGVVVGGVWGV